MAKFCGNCGAQLEDSARVCGFCGTPLADSDVPTVNVPGVQYVDPAKKEKIKKIAILAGSAVAVIVVLSIVINFISGFVGYKGVVRKVMNAYEDYDIDAMISMSSDLYSVYDETFGEEYAEEYFENIVNNDLDYIEDCVGNDYKFNYEISDVSELSKRKLDNLKDELERYEDFDVDEIEEVKVVEVEIVAKDGKDTCELERDIVLTKEDGDWRILYIN